MHGHCRNDNLWHGSRLLWAIIVHCDAKSKKQVATKQKMKRRLQLWWSCIIRVTSYSSMNNLNEDECPFFLLLYWISLPSPHRRSLFIYTTLNLQPSYTHDHDHDHSISNCRTVKEYYPAASKHAHPIVGALSNRTRHHLDVMPWNYCKLL